MRITHTPSRPHDLFEVDGVTLKDGESTDVSKERAVELKERYGETITLGRDRDADPGPSATPTSTAQSASDTASPKS
jgi:hypothetical protein